MKPILETVDLSKSYTMKKGLLDKDERRTVKAVDGVSLAINQGETFGVVGESGCGKTTFSRLIMRLIEPTEGKVIFKGLDIGKLNARAMKEYRSQVQMIFQNPYGSLNPRMNILNVVSEPLLIKKIIKGRVQIEEKIKQTLDVVGLPSTNDFMMKLPQEVSGGQMQRVGIARALITGAELIIADEPVSMLDATIKARMVLLLEELKEKLQLTYIFITHEIGIAHHICDRIAVMYLGEVMELGKTHEIINAPLHPYTRLLMEAVPPIYLDENWGAMIENKDYLQGGYSGRGCKFYPRCPDMQEICKKEKPSLGKISNGRYVCCHQVVNEG